MDIERKITKKHIMIGIVCLVLIIGALILIFTACGNDSNKEKPVVEETTTTTTTIETSTTTEVTTTTTTSTTESTSTTSEATTTTTTITTEEIEDIPVINDEPSHNKEPETSVVKPVETTKAPVAETKPATTTTTQPVETEPPVVETQAPAASCNHYYGEVVSEAHCTHFKHINGSWKYIYWEEYGYGEWYFWPGMSDNGVREWMEESCYMKPDYEGTEGSDGIHVSAWVYLG